MPMIRVAGPFRSCRLPALYGRVLVPPAVVAELSQERTPTLVKTWLTNMPEWLHVQAPTQAHATPHTGRGAGEREAIALAAELSADALLMDDRDARQEAERLGIPVLGTLRVLVDASAWHIFRRRSIACEPQTFAPASNS
jgi:predicted nucleic acid-binding protein